MNARKIRKARGKKKKIRATPHSEPSFASFISQSISRPTINQSRRLVANRGSRATIAARRPLLLGLRVDELLQEGGSVLPQGVGGGGHVPRQLLPEILE